MNALFARELRRLAPFGGGALAVAFVVPFAAWSIGVDFGQALIWARLLGVALLGVATVAPDTSSGAIAFLARMPVSKRRILAAKLAVAGLFSLLVVLVPPLIFQGRIEGGRVAIGAAFAFGAGALASVMVARALPAAIVAAIIGTVVPLAFAIPALLLDVDVASKHGVMWPALAWFSLAFVAIAFVVFGRGDRHRVSPRPALLGLTGMAVLVLATFSGVAVAHSWSVSDAPRWLKVQNSAAAESRDGRFVAVSMRGSTWAAVEERVAVIDREKKTLRLLATRDVTSPTFSPGGKLLLRDSRGPGGWLIANDRAERLEAGWDAVHEGFGSELVLWKDERPFFVRAAGAKLVVCAPGGEVVATHPLERMRIEAASGSVLVLAGPLGLTTLDPWSGETTRVDLEDGSIPSEAAISPSCRRAVVVTEGEHRSVFVLDLDAKTRRRFGEVPDLVRGKLSLAAFSPDEKTVAIPGLGMLGFLDLESGTWRSVDVGRPTNDLVQVEESRRADTSSPWHKPAWSTDGSELAVGWGPVVSAAKLQVTGKPAPDGIVAWVAPGLAVRSGEPLVFVDSTSGHVVARPFEGR